MVEMYGSPLRTAYPPRLLVLAFSFLSSALAALLAITCFVLGLNKRSDPNGAISLPGGQKFATFFTAGIFLAVLPIPLIMFLSSFVHNRQRHSLSSFGSPSKVYKPATVQGLSLSPTKPFFFISSKLCRLILAVAILIQLADAVAFTTVVCIRQNTDICLFNGRVVLCNLLTTAQKLSVIIPGFIQILSQIALLILIKPYARSVGDGAKASTNAETFAPISTSLKGGTRSQGLFQMVPGFDPDLEKDGDLTTNFYDQRYDPVDDETAKELRSSDLYSLYNVPTLSATGKFNFAQAPKSTMRTSSSGISTAGSHMQGPRPAPKRTSSVIQYAPIAAPEPLAAPPRKNKEWFKRFKSKTIESIPADDEDAGEAEALVSGSGRTHGQPSDKSEISQDQDADVDSKDEGAL